MPVQNFINLTNGLQAIQDFGLDLKTVHFLRIQSTWCEQHRWDDILWTLSDDFLMFVAIGTHCRIFDYGAGKDCPRAIWQGLEFIKFALFRCWYNKEYNPQGRSRSSKDYFQEAYKYLHPRVIRRLKYFTPFLKGGINISAVTSITSRDGIKQYFKEVLDEARK